MTDRMDQVDPPSAKVVAALLREARSVSRRADKLAADIAAVQDPNNPAARRAGQRQHRAAGASADAARPAGAANAASRRSPRSVAGAAAVVGRRPTARADPLLRTRVTDDHRRAGRLVTPSRFWTSRNDRIRAGRPRPCYLDSTVRHRTRQDQPQPRPEGCLMRARVGDRIAVETTTLDVPRRGGVVPTSFPFLEPPPSQETAPPRPSPPASRRVGLAVLGRIDHSPQALP
jgi:hypothetical protein